MPLCYVRSEVQAKRSDWGAMIPKRRLQVFLMGLLVSLSLTASEPCYSYGPDCGYGLVEDCRWECQRMESYFGSYIPVCTFKVRVCSCVSPSG